MANNADFKFGNRLDERIPVAMGLANFIRMTLEGQRGEGKKKAKITEEIEEENVDVKGEPQDVWFEDDDTLDKKAIQELESEKKGKTSKETSI